MLYKEAVALFSQYLKSEKMRSPETCRAYRADLEDFQGFVAGVDPRALSDVSRIDPLLIREFLADRFIYLAKESLARKVACIRSFFKFLVREGIVQNNPAAAIRAPKRSRPLPRALSVDDMDRFFSTQLPHVQTRRRHLRIALFIRTSSGRIDVSEIAGHRLGKRVGAGDGQGPQGAVCARRQSSNRGGGSISFCATGGSLRRFGQDVYGQAVSQTPEAAHCLPAAFGVY